MPFPIEGPIWFVGCGNMGGAMLARWLANGLDPARVTVIRKSGAAVAPGVTVLTAPPPDGAVPALIVLAVKPQMLAAVAPAVAPMLGSETLLVSILAGVETATLRRLLPAPRAVLRAMPNTPVAIGRGVVALHGDGLDGAERAHAKQLMAPLGLVEWVDEGLFDVVTALAGSGPAFLFRFVDALAAAGADAGLDAEQAARLALATVSGAGALANGAQESPAALAERVASPGGSTRKGLDVLDEPGALRALLRDTLDAAILRNRELAAAAPMSEPLDPARVHRIAKLVLTIALVALGLWIGGTFLPALVWAAIIAIAIDPLYRRAEARWPGSRGMLLPLIATTLIALLVLVPLAMAAVEAGREAKYLFAWLADARENGLPQPDWLGRLPLFSDQVATWWHDNLETPEGTAQQFHRFRSAVLIEQSQLLGKGLILRSVIFLFTLLGLFFLLRDRDTVVAQLERAGERLLGPSAQRLGTQVILSVRGTIDGLVLVGIGEGAVMAVVYLVAGVPHPLLLGSFTAIAAMIPFGAALLFLIAGGMLVAEGAIGWAVAVFAIGMGVVFIADHFIRPVLIGGATRLPFLFVLIGILGGVEMLGLLGLFVGPAAMAVLIMLWRDYVSATPPPHGSPAAPLP